MYNISQVEKAIEPPKKQHKATEALPVVGVVALVVAGGAYLWKTKPWKASGRGAQGGEGARGRRS